MTTEEMLARLKVIGPIVAADRLARLHEAGVTKKGRVIGVWLGEPAPEVAEWHALSAALTADRVAPHEVL